MGERVKRPATPPAVDVAFHQPGDPARMDANDAASRPPSDVRILRPHVLHGAEEYPEGQPTQSTVQRDFVDARDDRLWYARVEFELGEEEVTRNTELNESELFQFSSLKGVESRLNGRE